MMKKRWIVMFIFFLPVLAMAQVKTISASKAERKMKKPLTVLDVRTPGEFNAGHLPGAILANWQDSVQFMQTINNLDKSATYLVYCRTGKRSAEASERMEQAGFKKLYNMKGGIVAWEKRKQKNKGDKK